MLRAGLMAYGAAALCDPKLWALMQRIEIYRHYAERLESAGARAPPLASARMLQASAELRQLAHQLYLAAPWADADATKAA